MNMFVAVGAESGIESGHLLSALGMVRFVDGIESESYYTPVQSSPRHALEQLREWAGDGALIYHGPFTRDFISQACLGVGIEISGRWIDTGELVPLLLPGASGKGLQWMAEELGIAFHHDDACKRARTCGAVCAAALNLHGLEEIPFMTGGRLVTATNFGIRSWRNGAVWN
jgi:DNA polymerase III epsilon subunit-like protein